MLVDELSPESQRKKVPLYIGLDLSLKQDLTGISYIWDMGKHYECDNDILTPMETLEKRAIVDETNYGKFVADGHMIGLPGPVITEDAVVARILDRAHGHNIRILALDSFRLNYLALAFQRAGVSLRADPLEKPDIICCKVKQNFFPPSRGMAFEHNVDPEQELKIWMSRNMEWTEEVLMTERFGSRRTPCSSAPCLRLRR